MQRTFPLFLMALAGLLTACSYQRPVTEATAREQQTTEVIERSLFDPATGHLSEEDVQRLLNGHIVIHDSARIAVYRYGQGRKARGYGYGYGYGSWSLDEEYLKTQQSYMDTLMSICLASPLVQETVLMPPMMVSPAPDLLELRTNAVRLQADLLLVFGLDSDIYYKYRMFAKDDAKAFATCQALLMDVRTGVIPHSTVFTREHLTTKAATDLTLEETRKRAERAAVMSALGSTGKAITGFLSSLR